MQTKAIILGVKKHLLTKKEKELFKKFKPWGIILFSRNIKNITQLKSLIDEIRKLFNDKKFPIMIDQEGGKVSRLNKILDFSAFSQSNLKHIYKKNKKLFYSIYNIYVNEVCNIFNFVGININTTPVLDIRRKNAHHVIGSRSFSNNVDDVVKLGNICIKLFEKKKILTVAKHIPGHGLAKHDSHLQTPLINASKTILEQNDFKVFKSCRSLFSMTCHAIFSSYDKINVATHSKKIIRNVIRKNIGFKGLLITDDISMKSLKHKLERNALKALNAGCNLVLHCNGNIREMYKLVKVVPKIDKFTKKKTSQFNKFLM